MTTIAIQLCTFRRPQVAETIASLARQNIQNVDLRLIVADNDDSPSARGVVAEAAADLPFPWEYVHAPAANISLARNACLDAAGDADWVASLDDDEIAPEEWLDRLYSRALDGDWDGVFGPVRAIYPPEAPGWMLQLDPHSLRFPAGPGVPITGVSGNSLLRWKGTPWQQHRFDPARGRTGGEDTAYFHALHLMGARYAIAHDAELTEMVESHRLKLDWLAARRFRMGQTHIVTARGGLQRGSMFLRAAAKASYCRTMERLGRDDEVRRNFWYLRGQLHRGVCAALLGRREPVLYGHQESR